MAEEKKAFAPLLFSSRAALRVRRLRPRMAAVNAREPQQSPPGVGETKVAPSRFVSDGFMYPRPEDALFDIGIRIASIGPGAGGNPNVLVQDIFTSEDRIKGGWIRELGYEFNNPHGFFQVRTTILVNSGTPSNYHFRTVDSVGGTSSGSFPTLQLGSIREPTAVWIYLPAQSLVQVRVSNASQNETFSLVMRLKGWEFGN